MKPNDTYLTAELFTVADFETYLKHGWTLLDIKSGSDAYPVIYVVKKEKKTEASEGKDNER